MPGLCCHQLRPAFDRGVFKEKQGELSCRWRFLEMAGQGGTRMFAHVAAEVLSRG